METRVHAKVAYGTNNIATALASYDHGHGRLLSEFHPWLYLPTANSFQGTPQPPIKRFGLTELYIPSPASSALVDLVFVHGLNGEPDRTWTSKTNNCLWPRDLLPSAVEEEKVRILTFGYDADVTQTLGEGVTKDKIHNHAENLVASLVANRSLRHAKERPIIFVAHSLGGLVVKRALIVSSENTGVKTAHLRSVWVSTYGVLFLGTPHKGADISKWGGYLERICRVVVPKQLIDSQPQLLEALKTNSETLINIDRQFANLMGRLHLFYFHEGKPTDMKGTLRWVSYQNFWLIFSTLTTD